MFDSGALRARLTSVREHIARAAGRAGRDPASVRLIAVSKTFSTEHIRTVAGEGHLDFGENKVQEGLQKIEETADLSLRWHLIGHLQSNKARKATRFDVVHAIDDAALLTRMDEAAAGAGRAIDALIQVDLAHEPGKHGAPPEDLTHIFLAATACRSVRVRGLMLVPPAADDPELTRPYFARVRRLRDDLLGRGIEPTFLTELSMGMSHDYEIAIEEGATMVRVGSAIFGARNYA